MAICEECGDGFNQIADWQKMCPKCYYALHPEKDFRKKARQRFSRNRDMEYAQKYGSAEIQY